MNTGDGILQLMQTNNDHPITPSKYEHYDEDGNLYTHGTLTVESCWGTKGLYIASNLSGNWEVQGPFGNRQGS